MSYSSDILPILESVSNIGDQKGEMLNDNIGTFLLRAENAGLPNRSAIMSAKIFQNNIV